MIVTMPGDEPDEKQQAGRADRAGDVGADDEDARADHGAHDDHHGVEERHLALEVGAPGSTGAASAAGTVMAFS